MSNTYTIAELSDLFDKHLSQMHIPEDPQYLYAPIRYAMADGGKHIRPNLLLLAYNVFDDNVKSALNAALAVELFHNFTLLHDDIMDNADVRRGRPSVYAKWGSNVAILSGDAMLIIAYSFLRDIPSAVMPQVFETFNSMAVQVCEGQQYDMDFETKKKVSIVDYMHMIELKTSALLAGSAMIGATMAGASSDDAQKIRKFATELGLAFQLQDDLLDSYGDERLGKKIGGDILEGKKTYLMVMAMSKSNEAQREILRNTRLDNTLTEQQKIDTVKALYDSLDIPRITEQQIGLRFARAVAILDTLDVPMDRTMQLRAYAESLMGRSR